MAETRQEERPPRSPTFFLGAALAAFTVVLSVFVGLAWLSDRSVDQASRWVNHTLEVQRRIGKLQSDLEVVEAGNMARMLSGEASYVEAYNRTTTDIDQTLLALALLVADNPAQTRRIADLKTLFGAQRRAMDSSVEFVQNEDRIGGHLIGRRPAVDSYSPRIQNILEEASKAEAGLEIVRQKVLVESSRKRDMVSIGLIAVLAALLAGLFAAMKRAAKYENLIKICAWSKTVNYRGEWISYDQYLQRRFNVSVSHGISPEALDKLERESNLPVP